MPPGGGRPTAGGGASSSDGGGDGGRPWWRRGPVLAGAVLVAGLGIALGVVATGGSGGGGSAQAVEMQPVSASGQEPFTDSVANGGPPASASPSGGTASGATPSTAGSPSAPGGTVDGSQPGLYGGTREVASCDVPKLSGYLDANPDKAHAWAGVEGIDSSQIDGYLHGLTPVVLRQDTRVTNHGYQNGQATPYQAVLQSGTAVLIDSQGVPRVRCACGNPLTPPTGTGGTYTGTAWSSFHPDGVVTVQLAAAPVTQIVLVDQTTGGQFGRPVGGTGGSDGSASPSASGSGSSGSHSGTGAPSGASSSAPSSGASSGPSSGSPGSPGHSGSSGSSGPSGSPKSPGAGSGSGSAPGVPSGGASGPASSAGAAGVSAGTP
ncbi:hypothetical protein KSE_04175 [Kitasatospora setae KM-6054]|uniref:DUF6777 domain-containing protein n=1 Tax=Kitasatospora setae (strain ATCC 33774 / DSM 43861 / JCM 3304 / KCC A-0304 / NBRC 14216 / KM-6054) TaxID=452652 RepID=E4N4Y3_KITSK|nr:hypothetical protein KSE_04175 [Kitasatospora setae KM-6054]